MSADLHYNRWGRRRRRPRADQPDWADAEVSDREYRALRQQHDIEHALVWRADGSYGPAALARRAVSAPVTWLRRLGRGAAVGLVGAVVALGLTVGGLALAAVIETHALGDTLSVAGSKVLSVEKQSSPTSDSKGRVPDLQWKVSGWSGFGLTSAAEIQVSSTLNQAALTTYFDCVMRVSNAAGDDYRAGEHDCYTMVSAAAARIPPNTNHIMVSLIPNGTPYRVANGGTLTIGGLQLAVDDNGSDA